MDIKDLTPNSKNPRKISAEKLSQLEKSLKEFGSLDGFIFNLKTNRLVGGHQRQKVFKSGKVVKIKDQPYGYVEWNGERFPYREVKWDEAKEKAANIAANKGAGEWDKELLGEWFKDLEGNFDLDLTMFDAEERKEYLPEESKEGLCDADEVPEVKQTAIKMGDLFQLGAHRLLCGDSTDPAQVSRLMNGEKADMVFTDPPYGMGLETDYKGSLGDNGFRTAKTYKKVHGDDTNFDFISAFKLVSDVGEQFWWGADYYCQQLPKDGSWFVWNKRTTDGLQRMYGNHFELCWSKQKHQREIAEVTWAGAFGHNKTDDGQTKTHPTMKAVKLIEWFFKRFKGQLVLDLFLGSGSTLIACEKTNRKCYGMEIDPQYCQVIIDRFEKFTGKKAVLLNKKAARKNG